MGYTLTFSAPPALQGFAAYYGGQQAAQRQTDDTQARIDAQNDAQLNSALAGLVGGAATGGLAGYYYNQAMQPAYGPSTGYSGDGMGPPAPGILPGEHDWMNKGPMGWPANQVYGDAASRQRNLMMTQMLLGGPQAASGYLANQEQFRNRMIAQNDAQSFQGEQRQLDRDFTTDEREARQEYRTNERIAGQDFYVNEQIPAQVAGRLGTTPAGVYDTGVQSVIAQGGDPATMSREQIMGIGMQTVQQQNQVRDLTNRQVFSGIQQQQGQIAQNTKPVYSPQQKQRVVQLQNAAANLQSDPKYFNSATGMPTPLGLSARQRIQAELNSIQPRMEYQEPPPSLGETLGIIQPVPAQGPPTQTQVSPMGVVPGQQPSSGQFQSPYGEVLVNGTGVAAIQLPNGKMMTFHNDGQKVNMRVEDVKTPQSGGFTPGETVELDGVKAGIRKENGDVSWYPEYVMDMANPQKARQSGKSGGGAEKDKSLAVNTYFKAMSQKKDYEMSDGSIEARSVSEAEARDIAVNALEFAGGYERSQGFDDIQEPAAKRNALRAKAMSHAEVKSFNSLLPQGSRPVPAREIVDGTVKVLDRQNPWDERRRARLAKYLVEANLMDEGDIPGEIAGEYLNLAEAQDAARNRGGQPYERPFKKTKDGPTYIGLYDPATGKVTNERLLKQ